MKIAIRELSLRNFKGIKELTLSNLGNEVNVMGANATGKTTIHDAFRFLLFGKNAEDKTDFSIKTLTSDGQPIHKLEHEVIGVLEVDGVPTSFKRILREKWVKPKGQADVVMQGHETEYFYNDVPKTMKEYMSKIDEICPESHFKLLTDPSYFPSMPWMKQREILFGLAGEITDNDIAGKNPAFIQLLKQITEQNISLVEFKKKLSTERLKLKAELELIPARIDEVFKGMPEVRDWMGIIKQIAGLEDSIKSVNELIDGTTSANTQLFEARNKAQDQKNALIKKRDAKAFEIETAALKEINNAKSALDSIKFNTSTINTERNRLIATNSLKSSEIKTLNETLIPLREEWRKISAETLTFKAYDFCCPTCAREYNGDKYEAIQMEMTAKFNEHKAARLKENEAKGKETAGKVKAIQKEFDDNLEKIKGHHITLATLKEQQTKAEEAIPAGQPNIAALLLTHEELIALTNQVNAVRVPEVETVDITRNQADRALYQTQIDALKKDLTDRDTIAKGNARMTELNEQQVKLSQQQADLEKTIFTIESFEKTKIENIEARINGMFEMVKFKMFEQQINGGETPTCVMTVKGVPYPDLNNAMKINAGLDVIKTLSKAKDVYAPIFTDNAESVNATIPMETQMIKLIVTTDKTLQVS